MCVSGQRWETYWLHLNSLWTAKEHLRKREKERERGVKSASNWVFTPTQLTGHIRERERECWALECEFESVSVTMIQFDPVPQCLLQWSSPTASVTVIQAHSVCYNDPTPQCLLQWSSPTVSVTMIQSHSVCYNGPVPQCLLQWSSPTRSVTMILPHSVYCNDPVPEHLLQ